MIAITIAGILLALAIPSYTDFIHNERQITQANALVFALSYARSEAIKRDGTICVCPYNTASPPNTATCGTDWKLGWIVHIPDPTQNPINCTLPNTALTAPLPILQTGPPTTPGAANSPTTLTATLSSTAVTSIGFQGIGTALANNASITGGNNVQFKLCDVRGYSGSSAVYASARDVEVSANGRAQASTTAGQTLNGTALTCP
ncbi:MAG: GspH/FimT family pseudopilin [Nevskia sp.]|nr:GspH/FimT family pseudopilin [Nevskia sp.]